MSMRTTSIISDPQLTEPTAPPIKKEQRKPSDFERLANGDDYPQVVDYLDSRIEYFSSFAPDGTPAEKLSQEQVAFAWGQSVVVIRELKALKNTLATMKRK